MRGKTRSCSTAWTQAFLLALATVVWPSAVRPQAIGPDSQVSSYPFSSFNVEPIVVENGGLTVAVWNQGTPGSRVRWAYSANDGDTWLDQGVLPLNGDGALCAGSNGRFHAVAYSCCTPTVFTLLTGTPNGAGLNWSQQPIPVPPSGTSVDYSYRTWLSSDPDRGYLYFTFTRHVGTQFPAYTSFDATIYFMRSLDGGASWSSPMPLSSPTSVGARSIVGVDGAVHVLWEDQASRTLVGRRSIDFGSTFAPEFAVAAAADNMNAPPPGWLAVSLYHSPVSIYGDHFTYVSPRLAVDRSGGPRHGTIYVAWSEGIVGEPDPPVGDYPEVEPNGTLETATVVPIGSTFHGQGGGGDAPDNDYFAFDGTAGTHLWITGEIFTSYQFDISYPVLVYAVGATPYHLLTTAINAGPEFAAIHTLPYTGRYFLGVPGEGYAVWLGTLSPPPGQVARDQRDVVVVSSSDGGETWSSKTLVNDDQPLFDNSFPEVAVDVSGRLHVAWFDRRDDPLTGTGVNTYWAMSTDGAQTFAASRRLSSATGYWQRPNAGLGSSGRRFGERFGLLAKENRVLALWPDGRNPVVEIRSASITVDGPTAVRLRRFTADAEHGAVIVRWQFGDTQAIGTVELERSDDGAEYELRFSDRVSLEETSFRDELVRSGKRYTYRLRLLGANGASSVFGPVDVELPRQIERLAFEAPTPNPFTQDVVLQLNVPTLRSGSVAIYDVRGHAVRSLHEGELSAGPHALIWDGRHSDGREAPAGIYFVRAQLSREHSTQRVIKIN